MDFVSTKFGHQICNLAIDALNKYANKKQHMITCTNTDIEQAINEELKKGSLLVHCIPKGQSEYILIFEN